jgi:tRNA modification GTPase
VPDPLLTQIPMSPLIIRNKIDLTGQPAGRSTTGILYLSAKTGEGIDVLKQLLKETMGLHSNIEGTFLARRRHLDALQRTQTALQMAFLHANARHSELLAEELRQAQQALGEITGQVTTEDLLGRIFSTFCIGK